MSPPIIKALPEYEPYKVDLPQVLTMGPQDTEEGEFPGFRFYVDVCRAYEDAASAQGYTNEDVIASLSGYAEFENAEDLFELYGITAYDACNFAIFGYTAQQQIDFESELARWAVYTDKLRIEADGYRQQLIDRYEIVKTFGSDIKRQLTDNQE